MSDLSSIEDNTPLNPQSPSNDRGSPIGPKELLNLFLRPRRFFDGSLRLDRIPELLVVTYLTGISAVIGKVDQRMTRYELGSPTATPGQLDIALMESWTRYWVMVLSVGVISAGILWLVGGWWFGKRISISLRNPWADSNDHPPHSPREVYVYQNLVQTVPLVFVTFIQTLIFKNYHEAWLANNSWTVWPLLVFTFWSCWTAYSAVTSSFDVEKGKAKLWFLYLPIAFYVFAFAGLTALLGATG